MEEREEFIIQSVSYLQTLKTKEDYKAAREEIINIMENLVKTGVKSLENFLENVLELSPEEREEQGKKFQDDSYLLDPRIGVEMERLESIPGVDEFADEMEIEFEKRLEPLMAEYAEKGPKLMEALMDNLVGEIDEGFTPVEKEEKEEAKEEFIFDYGNPDTPDMFYDLYASRTLAELEENKDRLIESIEEQMQDDIYLLELLTDPGFTDKQDEDIQKIEKILHRMKRFKPEMDKEFARLAALPDAAEKTGEIQKEITERVNPKLREIKRHLAKPWRR